MSIEIISDLVPINNGSFPTHHAEYGKGGWISVASQSELASISPLRLEAGMAARAVDTGITYVLQSDLVTWVADTSGGGIPEAPIDGNGYVRSDGAWQVVGGFTDEGTYA
jgi:hypothetical protein